MDTAFTPGFAGAASAAHYRHLEVGIIKLLPDDGTVRRAPGDVKGGGSIKGDSLPAYIELYLTAKHLRIFIIATDVHDDFIIIMGMFMEAGIGVGDTIYPAGLYIVVRPRYLFIAYHGHGR